MNEQTSALRTIEQRVRIAATPETVWQFWTDPTRLCEWWGTDAQVDPQPGGMFRVVMSEEGPVMSGSYVTLEPFSRLVFTFGWENNAPGEPLAPGSTRVEVTLTAVAAETNGHTDTDVLLRHSEVPTDYADDHGKGWALFVGEKLPQAVIALESATR